MWLRSNLGKAGVFNVSDIEKDVLYYTDEFFNFFFFVLTLEDKQTQYSEKDICVKGFQTNSIPEPTWMESKQRNARVAVGSTLAGGYRAKMAKYYFLKKYV